jgi:hypothetical protein
MIISLSDELTVGIFPRYKGDGDKTISCAIKKEEQNIISNIKINIFFIK